MAPMIKYELPNTANINANKIDFIEMQDFLKNLKIITLYKNLLVAIHKSWPRIFLIERDYKHLLENNSIIPKHFIRDYNRLKAFGYLPTEKIHLYKYSFLPHLLLRVSEDCNLSCRYCYNKDNMLNSLGIKNMPKEVAVEGARYFLTRFKSREVRVSFSGGEPLLNFATIRHTINYLNSIKQGRIKFTIQTNGTIMNKEISHCVLENNVELIVTLDFPSCEQNRNRPFKNGNPNFEKVKNNLIMITKKGYSNLIVKSNIAHDSKFAPTQVIQAFYESGIPVKRIIIGREFTKISEKRNIMKLKNDEIEGKLRLELNANRLHFINKRVNPFGQSQNEVADKWLEVILNGRKPIEPCEAGLNGFVVNPVGDIYTCNVVVNDDRFHIGNINYGIDESRFQFLKEKYFSKPKECFSCWAGSFCNTICPLVIHKKDIRGKKCREIKHDFLNSLKFFLSLDYGLICRLLEQSISQRKRENYVKNLPSNLKVILRLYRTINLINRYIRPVNILPYY